MDGQQLKDILYTTRIPQAELGRRLGMSQQSFNQALNVKDIKTGFLEKLCKALDVKMAFFYPDDYDQPQTIVNNYHPEGAIASGTNSTATAGVSDAADKATIKTLLEQNKQLMEQNKQLFDLLKAKI